MRSFDAILAQVDARLGDPPLPLPIAPKKPGGSNGQGNGRGFSGVPPPPPPPMNPPPPLG